MKVGRGRRKGMMVDEGREGGKEGDVVRQR